MADPEIISPLQQLRDGMALIREAIQEHVPIGALEAKEHTGVEPLEEVAALVKAIHAIAGRMVGLFRWPLGRHDPLR